MAGIADNLANKVLKLQKQTGAVPGNIMTAARMIKQGSASPAHVEAIRQFFGISRSGATQLRRGASEANQALAQSQAFSQSLGAIAHGDVGGYSQLTGVSAKYLDQIAKSPAFQAVVQRVAKQFVEGDDSKTVDLNSRLSAGRIGYSLRRGARFAVAAAATANVIAEAAGLATSADDVLMGRAETESTRRTKQDELILDVDSTANSQDRRLAIKKSAAASIEDLSRGNPLGAIGAWRGRAKIGVDAVSIGKLETAKVLRDNGLAAGLTNSMYSTALEEARRSSGTPSKLAYNLGIVTQELEENTQKNLQNRVTSAKTHMDEAYEAASRREFGLASAHAAVANKELPGTVPVWNNIAVYKSQQADRAAVRMWSAYNNPRAGERTGGD